MNEEIDRQEYNNTRQEYVNQETHQTDNLDKYILTISTGSFGLSFIFIEKIVKEPIIYPKILVYSWIMFVCSIISSLLSFLFSKIAHEKSIKEYDRFYNNQDTEFKIPIQDKFTRIFNGYSLGFLIVGFVSFIIFAYFNVVGE